MLQQISNQTIGTDCMYI